MLGTPLNWESCPQNSNKEKPDSSERFTFDPEEVNLLHVSA
jgi:hypothetical protein